MTMKMTMITPTFAMEEGCRGGVTITTGASKPLVLAVTNDSRVFTIDDMQPITYGVVMPELTGGMARVRTDHPDIIILRYQDQYTSL